MKNSNITWLDPTSNTPVCTLEGCRKKFKQKTVEQVVLTVVDDKKITYDMHYSVCNECGRKHAMTTDVQKTKKSKTEVQNSLMFLRDM